MILGVTIVVAAATVILSGRITAPTTSDKPTDTEDVKSAQPNMPDGKKFDVPQKSDHYLGNNPAHGSILESTTEASVTFNTKLAPNSTMSIMLGDKDYSIGDLIISEDKLMMRKAMDPSAPKGTYKVKYKACWADKSCSSGYFQFAIK